MSSKQELQSKVEELSQIVVSVHNTLVTLLDYIEDSIEVEDDEDKDETCCDCGKPVY
jgi:predicted transcriptional regulator